MDQSDEEFGDFIESASYEETKEVDYADEIWNDRSFHVKVRITNRRSFFRSNERSLHQDEVGEFATWDDDLALWEGEGDDWSVVKSTEVQPEDWQVPLRLPVKTQPQILDEFEDLGSAQETTVETEAIASALPELRQACRVYGDEDEARIARQKGKSRFTNCLVISLTLASFPQLSRKSFENN